MNMRDIIMLLESTAPSQVPDVLWHGTGCLRAAAILKEKHLRQWAWDHLGAGVSFADDKDSAEVFAIRSDTEDAARAAFQAEHGPDADYNYDSGEAEDAFPDLYGVLFQFDGNALASKFRFKPVSYSGGD